MLAFVDKCILVFNSMQTAIPGRISDRVCCSKGTYWGDYGGWEAGYFLQPCGRHHVTWSPMTELRQETGTEPLGGLKAQMVEPDKLINLIG